MSKYVRMRTAQAPPHAGVVNSVVELKHALIRITPDLAQPAKCLREGNIF